MVEMELCHHAMQYHVLSIPVVTCSVMSCAVMRQYEMYQKVYDTVQRCRFMHLIYDEKLLN